MQPFIDALTGFLSTPVWAAPTAPANVRLPLGVEVPGWALGIAYANTGGQDSASGTEPIPPSNAGTLAAGTAGVAFDGDTNAAFDQIVTALVLRNLSDNLRNDLVVLQASAFARAKNVPGTNNFTYTFFADLGAAEDLLEGIPPVTVPLTWDTFSFTGTQKGKLVAITDLAEVFSPFELYRIAAEKVAWNAMDTAETAAVTLLMAATGITVTGGSSIAENIVNTKVALSVGNVPKFPDGTYHALISPADAAIVMLDTESNGWTETSKYAQPGMLLNGELGRFRGVTFIESNRITDGKTVVFGPEMVIWGDWQTIQAYRVAPGGDHADPLAQRGLVGWKGMWGMKLAEFDGTPAIGPASNPGGKRYAVVDLTDVTP